MVRMVAVQVIKWYANIHENQRITTSNELLSNEKSVHEYIKQSLV